ncbi:Bacterial non-heme ferritin [Methanimicrococcus sp. At1]|uniref:Bacterial non-heme ferritin n=1 Tax=Methanimicrococcus hacksteinii TaxID=3028293 RepID=A0ABU3VN04_9EURY|nr:ferritin [Methanimicrococcus sp. At1]MDV0444781.1 Bacterial non-heme ferritin [Methanimicrococcus sp. At1]
MIKKPVLKLLNEQINKEFYAAYLYLGMSSKCTEMSRDGFAQWLRVQAEEEIEHAMKIYDFLHESGENVDLLPIDKPALKGKTLLDFFKQAYEHEQLVTASINNIMDVAVKEKDYASQVFLQWFVTEQVEEEDQTSKIVADLTFAKNDAAAILAIEKKLGKREDDD